MVIEPVMLRAALAGYADKSTSSGSRQNDFHMFLRGHHAYRLVSFMKTQGAAP